MKTLVSSFLILSLFCVVLSCNDRAAERSITPPLSFPLSRDNPGYGVVINNYAQMTGDAGASAKSQAVLRKGSIVKIISLFPVRPDSKADSAAAGDNAVETWCYIEVNNERGYLPKQAMDIYDRYEMAKTASQAAPSQAENH
jgi:hypothetical protein